MLLFRYEQNRFTIYKNKCFFEDPFLVNKNLDSFFFQNCNWTDVIAFIFFFKWTCYSLPLELDYKARLHISQKNEYKQEKESEELAALLYKKMMNGILCYSCENVQLSTTTQTTTQELPIRIYFCMTKWHIKHRSFCRHV